MSRLVLYKNELCPVVLVDDDEAKYDCIYLVIEYSRGFVKSEMSEYSQQYCEAYKRYICIDSKMCEELPDCPLTWAIYGRA